VTRARRLALAALGAVLLVLSGLGFPLTQIAIARGRRRGAGMVEGVAAGLLIRDIALVRGGAPARLQPVPRCLLWLELGAAALSALTGLAAIARPAQPLEPTLAGALEGGRRVAVGSLFGFHTWRFWIYLQPERGLLRATPTATSGVGSAGETSS
jgi:hypothetical protein